MGLTFITLSCKQTDLRARYAVAKNPVLIPASCLAKEAVCCILEPLMEL